MSSKQKDVRFRYLLDIPLYKTEKPFIYESNVSYDTKAISNVQQDLFPVSLENIRGREADFNCDQHGFAFVNHASAVDFAQPVQDSVAYILENSAIMKDMFQADRVICYDVRRRSGTTDRKSLGAIDENTFIQPRIPAPPVYAVHIDHTRFGGFHRARRHLTDAEIDEYITSGKWRIRVINTWRPIQPIDDSPMALCDPRTIDEQDLVETDLVSEDYVGETYSFFHNPKHRFYWLKDQQPNELCVFVTFDSLNSRPGSKITACPHTSFDNPWADPSSPPRKSIEVRSLVLNYLGDTSEKAKE